MIGQARLYRSLAYLARWEHWTEALEKEVDILRPLKEEVAILRPLKGTAVAIHERFFVTFLKSVASAGIGNIDAIETGNEAAHEGDIITDISLLESGLINYPTIFRRLYGFNLQDTKGLLGMLIDFFVSLSWYNTIANRRY